MSKNNIQKVSGLPKAVEPTIAVELNENEPLNFRRCHVCETVSAAGAEITKCNHCKKPFLPFYYFDKKKVSDYTDNLLRPAEAVQKDQPFGPIRGLTVYW